MRPFSCYLVLIGLGFLASSCSPPPSTKSRIHLSIPDYLESPRASSVHPLAPLSISNWGQSDPQSLAEINCYAVAIALPDPSRNQGVCWRQSGDTYLKYFIYRAGIPSGSHIEIEIPSGPARTIYLAGFAAHPISSCQDFFLNGGPLSNDLSAPFGLAKVTLDLVPGNQEVEMIAHFDPNQKFDHCSDFGSTPGSQPPTINPDLLLISPTKKSLPLSGSSQFFASGGTPPYVYSLASGSGTLDSQTGAFTASGTEQDVVLRVTDSLGQLADATIKVINVGTMDTDFNGTGGNGIVIHSFGLSELQGNDIRVLEDGKILVAGRAYNGSNSDAFIARFLSDGSLDVSFGSSATGIVYFDPSSGANDEFQALDILPDGRIVAVGTRNIGGSSDGYISSLLSDGTPDNSFDSNLSSGSKFIDINGASEGFNDVIVTPQGHIIVVGFMTDTMGGDKELLLGQMDSYGYPDTNFGGSGFVTDYTTSSDDVGTSIHFDMANNTVVVAGYSDSAYVKGTLWRYLSNGTLDSGFGVSGRLTLTSGSVDTYFNAIAQQSTGKLLAAGYRYDGNQDGVLFRINLDGTLDSSFGSSGEISPYYNSNNDVIESLLVQKDDKIVAVGNKLVSDLDWMILRYSSEGALDASFGGTGDFVVNAQASGNEWDRLFSVAFDPYGFLLAAGFANSSSGVLSGVSSQLGLIKIKNDGI
ncbi:MAG: hypothetical protein KDD35_05185 [Bdellovibrionales bacterium]|nr:hypothetical protein [Bdellovibrionales bacterium]